MSPIGIKVGFGVDVRLGLDLGLRLGLGLESYNKKYLTPIVALETTKFQLFWKKLLKNLLLLF